ncbi:MAG TPA: PD-(D/E)XK nuclease family protein [Solirubrobacterales bacterium]|nr:PD-(D/E)XK nuclease family protein [Solirubrobacterales bacterium]
MSISVIFGPPNSGRAGTIQARLEEALEREPVLVVPTADDAARFEVELCGSGGALLGASIHTFRRLTDEIGAATGAGLRPLLSGAQRLAVVRSVAREAELRVLASSQRQPGFAPAVERLIGELQATLIGPEELGRAASELDDGAYESELARLYAAYVERREGAGRDDAHSASAEVARSLRERPEAWASRPVFVYGFDDLTEEQLDLVSALGAAGEVTVAVNYEDNDALAARAELLVRLRDELAADHVEELPFDPSYTASATLRALDRRLFEVADSRVEPDGGLALMECGGERGEAEAVGGEIAHLLSEGVRPDDLVIVLRRPEAHGALYHQVLGGLGIPVAVEASVPLPRTAVGRGIVALGRCASPEAGIEDLLAFLRARPGTRSQSMADGVERRARRESIRTADDAMEGWKGPQPDIARIREAREPAAWLRELAAAARRLAEDPHAREEPVDLPGRPRDAEVPFEPLEARAAEAAASTLEELAGLEDLPGCAPPSPAQALEALDDVRVPLWHGPTEGRVRVLSPYRVRAARARHLFLASLQDGEFPGPEVVDPLLGDERRRRLGIPALTRRDPALEERYLFHACVARPTERLWLSWRSSDEEGHPAVRSPFVDDVLDLLAPDPDEAEGRLKRVHGLDRVVFAPPDAPSERALARALAAIGPRADPQLPGPIRAPAVLAVLAERNPVGAGTLEKWIECPYRWFVDHELDPQRLDPQPEALTTGSIVHEVLERLYREPPGDDRIPRPGDLERWRDRAHELLAEAAERQGLTAERPLSGVALERMRAQIDRLLERESRSETELRPALIEASFGTGDEADRPALQLGDLLVHGMIDRVDVTADGRLALVYDYKTSSRVTVGAKLAEEGKLQLQLYARAIRDQWEIEPLGGLYYQLGGSKNPRPRGFVAAGDATEGLDLTKTDVVDFDEVDATVEAGVETARERAAAMRHGSIGRDPNRGECPKWCRYQPICRLERSIAADAGASDGNGGNGS